MFDIILVENWCTGSSAYKYRVILGKCFYFESDLKTFQSAKRNCQSLTKQGRTGKLAEPRTLEMTTKLLEVSKDRYENQFGTGEDNVFIGVHLPSRR